MSTRTGLDSYFGYRSLDHRAFLLAPAPCCPLFPVARGIGRRALLRNTIKRYKSAYLLSMLLHNVRTACFARL